MLLSGHVPGAIPSMMHALAHFILTVHLWSGDFIMLLLYVEYLLCDWLVFCIVWDTNERYCTFPDLKGKFFFCGKIFRNKTNSNFEKPRVTCIKHRADCSTPLWKTLPPVLQINSLLLWCLQHGLAPASFPRTTISPAPVRGPCSSPFPSHRTLIGSTFSLFQSCYNHHLLPRPVVYSSHAPLTRSDFIILPWYCFIASLFLSLSHYSYLFIGLQPVIHF